MKNTVGMLFVLLCVPALAFAGAAPSKISCKSKDAKQPTVTLEGIIPVWGPGLKLTLSLGTSKIEITEPEDRAYAMEAVEHGVFSMAIARKDQRSLLLYALPKTSKSNRGPNFAHAEFEAVLKEAPKPGYVGPISAHAFIRDIQVICVYDWKL